MTRKLIDLTPYGTPKRLALANATVVEKGWGRLEDSIGEVFAYHAPQELPDQRFLVETVKLLHIAKGKRLSRHFHLSKTEIFVLAAGSLRVEIWDRDGKLDVITMRPDSRLIIYPGVQHRMTGLDEQNVLLEVSTLDKEDDSYRIEKGD